MALILRVCISGDGARPVSVDPASVGVLLRVTSALRISYFGPIAMRLN